MNEPILGAHESISGGLYRAVETAAALGCQCVQIFTKNSNQWNAKPLSKKDIDLFHGAREKLGIQYVLVHDSYLINLGSPDDALWSRSIQAFEHELLRANELDLPYVVMHPGSYTTSSESEGLARIAEGLNVILKKVAGIKTIPLLENTAGQGTNLGWKLDHLASIIEHVSEGELGVCFDTCHAFAAGYDFSTPEKYEALWAEFDAKIGLSRLRAFHLNDATKDLGSRIDRHAHIGCGKIPLDSFRLLLNDAKFRPIPMYLETPKGTTTNEKGEEEDWDIVNLRVLRSLVAEK
ncbi:MAG: deoxyribonuclease IV [Planctomycetia bacterium]|nr:deoxyribonuclease IV [Planctomycetia bacterium]